MKIKIISLFIVLVLLLNIIISTSAVFASDTDSSGIITGIYRYSSNENYNKQLEDSFEYRDDCFTRSSFLGCEHLETLSAQVAISSASIYGEEEDRFEIDCSDNGHNVIDLLEKMDFKDVSTNKYYTLEPKEDSGAVVVGHKEINASGKTYTLLAVIPRSARYRLEWVGNFNVGNRGIHDGFKAARDEDLRYLKKYIQENNIEGNLKIWTVGHSRGAAVSNMLGGFFAGGGIDYFGDSVSLTPEDVYCYTYATPKTITSGIDKNIELSVDGYRGGERYFNDTEGDAYSYTKGGTVNPEDEVYGGIRNFISPYDFISMLPMESWGYTYYGTEVSFNHDGKVSEEAMLNELKEISPYAYNKYINEGGPSLFEGMTFDIKTLKLVKDNNNINLDDFVKARVDGLAYKANSYNTYVNDKYQDGLMAAAGIYGVALVYLYDLDINEAVKDKENLAYAVLFTYLAYSSERLQEEGKAQNDIEASKIAIEDLLKFVLNKEVNDNTTVDEVFESFLKCACESENEIILDRIATLITEQISPDARSATISMVTPFYKNYDESVSDEEVWKSFIKACVYGTDEDSPAYSSYPTAKDARTQLYSLLGFAIMLSSPGNSDLIDLVYALFMDDEYNPTGGRSISVAIDRLYPIIMKAKNEDGETIKTFQNFAEAADYRLAILVEDIFDDMITDSKDKYGEVFQADFRKHVENAKTNIREIREAFTYFFLYEDSFSTEGIIRNIASFINKPDAVALAHYNEVYIAYAKAAENVDCGYEDHTIKPTDDSESNSTSEDTTIQSIESNESIKTLLITPKTGDDIGTWIRLMIISIVGILGAIVFYKRIK